MLIIGLSVRFAVRKVVMQACLAENAVVDYNSRNAYHSVGLIWYKASFLATKSDPLDLVFV
jgi:hypothetical protein